MLRKWIAVAFVVIIPFVAHADINQDLFEATRKGETAKVKYLLQAGADVNALEGETRGDGTALSLAAALGHTEVVRLLLAAGAEVKTRERQPRKGIDAAKLLRTVEENGYIEIAEMLKKALERELIGELADACYMGDFEVVRILVKMGADINAEDSDGVTAIEYAAAAGNKGIYEFLIANGANFDLFICSTAGDKHRVKELISNGADVNAINEYGSTALMLASRNQALEVMEILLINGARINYQDKQGRTALIMAAKNGRKEAVELLLNHNADIHIKGNDKKTALELAEWHKVVNIVVATEIIELLLDSETIIEAVANDSDVRIRTKPTTVNSRTIGSVDKGDKVIILGKSEKEEKILNMVAPWYKIKTEDGTVGYSYGYFFDVNVLELKAAPTF